MNLMDPISESFAAIESLDKRRREYKKVGWIYAARNKSFVDPVFKVGQSSRPPTARVAELSSSTSVYNDFDLVYFVHVSNRDIAEVQAHSALQEFRVNLKKEFFLAPLPVIVKALDRAASICPIQLGKTPRAGFLEQPLSPRLTYCPNCTAENRIPNVLVDVQITCGSCKQLI